LQEGRGEGQGKNGGQRNQSISEKDVLNNFEPVLSSQRILRNLFEIKHYMIKKYPIKNKKGWNSAEIQRQKLLFRKVPGAKRLSYNEW
jgi:hypothetical protein